jgi:hypothetical protein
MGDGWSYDNRDRDKDSEDRTGDEQRNGSRIGGDGGQRTYLCIVE